MICLIFNLPMWLRGRVGARPAWPWRDLATSHYCVAGALVAVMLATGQAPRSPSSEVVFSETVARGRAVYSRACAICHGINGEGRLPYGPRLGSQWLRRCREDELAAIILHGVSGPVPGMQAPPYPVMAALGSWLDDQDVAAVSTYVLRQWAGRASPVPPRSVEVLRAREASRSVPWTIKELSNLPSVPRISIPFP